MKELKKVPDLSIIFDMGVVALRFLMPVYAIIIVYQCFAAMRRRRRPETPLISLLNPATGEMLPVLFWENSIGRSIEKRAALFFPERLPLFWFCGQYPEF